MFSAWKSAQASVWPGGEDGSQPAGRKWGGLPGRRRPLPTALVDTHYLKAPGLCCRAARTTSSFSSWQTEHVE